MSDEQLTPERAVRLLRAKAGELEAIVALHAEASDGPWSVDLLRADIALIATLLADHIERMEHIVAHPMVTLTPEEKAFKEGFEEGRPSDDQG